MGIEKHPLKSAVPDGLSPTAPRPTESDDEAKQPKGYLVQTRSGGVEFRSGKISSLVFHDLARQGAQRRSCDPWILHGLIVNIAYSLGLHIDGEGTGLSPFDFVMRSRLWRQVVLVELEVKQTVAAGVGTFLMRKLSNTKLPSNLDDRELDPDMVTLPESHNRPTDMSFCLTAYERCFWMAGKLQQKEIHLVDELIFSDPSRGVDEAVTKKRSDARDWAFDLMATSARDLGPVALQRCPDMSNPLHAMITQTMASLECVLMALIMPMQETPEWGIEVHGPADNLFRITVVALEFAQREQQDFGHRFLWYANISFRLDGLFYVIAQLQERVSGSLAYGAWACIEKAYGYHEDLSDLDDKETMTLGNLVIVAWDARQAHFVSGRIPLPEPHFVTTLRETVMMMKVQALSLLAEV
ncbi:hypothetical protein BN1723_013308 [Verticillium longisporum]|uniref:Transcription factor domain-containing protein n=1 Tax=Verticillium longisporum TaxID=100787 RepID=A0A0G4LS66_VERLO|nr:hypothetical protein BN1723_013308 [Verticillium longisporum]